MNTKELLEAALKQAEKNGETMLVLHWNAGECQHMQTGDPAVIAGCMSMILGDGMSDGGKESLRAGLLRGWCYHRERGAFRLRHH